MNDYENYKKYNDYKKYAYKDKPSIVCNIVSLVTPIIGAIVYTATKEKMPKRAKSMSKWVMSGFIIGFLSSLIYIGVNFTTNVEGEVSKEISIEDVEFISDN